ncbi:MAG: hypothetical protein AAF434_12735 [Pseudomonadota bacterium]
MNKRIASFLILILVPLHTFAANQFVIISSNVESLNPGDTVKADQSLDLSEGQSVKLLSASGEVITIEGAQKNLLDRGQNIGDSKLLDAISRLLKSSSTSDSALAVYRGGGAPNAHAQSVPVDSSGNVCLTDQSSPNFWWPNPVKGMKIDISHSPSGERASITWASKKKRQPWPQALPIIQGDEYQIEVELSRHIHRFTLLMIPSSISKPLERVVWMSNNGCERQALSLLSSLTNN